MGTSKKRKLPRRPQKTLVYCDRLKTKNSVVRLKVKKKRLNDISFKEILITIVVEGFLASKMNPEKFKAMGAFLLEAYKGVQIDS